jgi:hypothetical protein
MEGMAGDRNRVFMLTQETMHLSVVYATIDLNKPDEACLDR